MRFALTVLVTVRSWSSHASVLDCCSIMIDIAGTGKLEKDEATGPWDEGDSERPGHQRLLASSWATLPCLPLPVANSGLPVPSLRSRARCQPERQWATWATWARPGPHRGGLSRRLELLEQVRVKSQMPAGPGPGPVPPGQ